MREGITNTYAPGGTGRAAPRPVRAMVAMLFLCATLVLSAATSAAGLRLEALLPPTPDWSAVTGQAGAHLGHAVASAGDVNGDRYGDLIGGAPSYDDGQMDEGLAPLWLGAPGGLPGTGGRVDGSLPAAGVTVAGAWTDPLGRVTNQSAAANDE